MEESKSSSSSSTPHLISFGNTPKRTLIKQHIGTPLQRIREIKDVSEREDQGTPVSANPFEVKADSLYFSSCSPSVFATFARNKSNGGQFRWSIDHVSLLFPAEIDETSYQELWVDADHEMKAQQAIDTFFSQSSIVPSPWSSESTKARREVKFRRTRRNSMLDAPPNEVATQTMVTIPPNVDLAALLGNEYVYNEEQDSSYSSPTSSSSSGSFRESDVMSTSSLRRKLFVTDKDCKTPSRLERKDLYQAKQYCTPKIGTRSMQSTPSDLLASSPITPPNCSESCIIRSSPQMSPIAPSSQKSIRMRSFIERLDEESNSQLTNKVSEDLHATSEISMSFCMNSQDTSTLQSNVSQKQDTGYVTGSMFSLQSVTSDNMSGFPSRITPVTELFDDCGISRIADDMSCISNNDMSIDAETVPFPTSKVDDSVLCGMKGWSLVPNSCSTPALNL